MRVAGELFVPRPAPVMAPLETAFYGSNTSSGLPPCAGASAK